MLLANYFADKYSARCNRKLKGFAPEARTCLTAYDWPGNVRELENTIERAVVLGTTDWILPEDLPEAVLETKVTADGSSTSYHEAVVQNKKQLILRAFSEAKNNHSEAARLLAIHPNYLHRLIRNLNLSEQLKHL
jgi:DNA-binding NtrC family response regulator